jgi:hypothetical protein
MGCAAGDYDGDGKVDLLLTGYHLLRLYHNAGGRFEDVTAAAGLQPDRWYTSAVFADLDGDGWLDLYVGGYVKFGPEEQQHCPAGVDSAGVAVDGPCGPEPYAAQPGRLYHNDHGRRFVDVTAASGLQKATGKTLGVACADYDADGRLDLYLANDRSPGDLFHNVGGGRFRNVGLASGTAYNRNGAAQSGMGVDWGDYDGDGRPDLFVATFSAEPKSLYHNDGGGAFQEAGLSAGLAPAEPYVAFGAGFLDADNDGQLDLLIANGHALGPIEKVDPTFLYREPLQLFLNHGDGTFREVSAAAGEPFRQRLVGRAAAFGDYDDDGRTDVLVTDLEGPARLLHNESPAAHHWLRVRLEGRPPNRQGIGGRVTLRAGGKRQVRQVMAGASFMAANDPRPLFGLGPAAGVEELEVRWPGGKVTRLRPEGVDREVVVREAGEER